MDNDKTEVDRTGTLLAHIRNVVAEEVKESGLKQTALAMRTGIQPVPLSALLRGKRTIYADELVVLIVELGIPLKEVFGEELWERYQRKMTAKS